MGKIIKKIIFLLTFVSSLHANYRNLVFYGCFGKNNYKSITYSTNVKNDENSHNDEVINECIRLNKEAYNLIIGLNSLNKLQNKSYEDFINHGISTELYYYKGKYVVQQTGKISIYDLNENYETYLLKNIDYYKKYEFDFYPELAPRPYSYFPNFFKLVGGFFVNHSKKEWFSDVMIGWEFFSFDNFFDVYGYSVNLSLGFKTVGISLGYQFYKSKLFRNTSLLLGYSYGFFDKNTYPFLGLALNF